MIRYDIFLELASPPPPSPPYPKGLQMGAGVPQMLLKPHAKFQNPTITSFGRKVSEAGERKKEDIKQR